MENFNFEFTKYRILLIIICSLFILLVWQAFSYLPQEENDINYQDINQTKKILSSKNNEEISVQNVEDNVILESDDMLDDEIDLPPTEIKQNLPQDNFEIIQESEIEEDNISKISNLGNNIEDLIRETKGLVNEQKYIEVIGKLETLAVSTQDIKIKTKAYEEIAVLYAKMKRYGSALSYAQKTYNLEPTSEKEILLARLYYKVGDTNRAQARMLNVLKRDF